MTNNVTNNVTNTTDTTDIKRFYQVKFDPKANRSVSIKHCDFDWIWWFGHYNDTIRIITPLGDKLK